MASRKSPSQFQRLRHFLLQTQGSGTVRSAVRPQRLERDFRGSYKAAGLGSGPHAPPGGQAGRRSGRRGPPRAGGGEGRRRPPAQLAVRRRAWLLSPSRRPRRASRHRRRPGRGTRWLTGQASPAAPASGSSLAEAQRPGHGALARVPARAAFSPGCSSVRTRECGRRAARTGTWRPARLPRPQRRVRATAALSPGRWDRPAGAPGRARGGSPGRARVFKGRPAELRAAQLSASIGLVWAEWGHPRGDAGVHVDRAGGPAEILVGEFPTEGPGRLSGRRSPRRRRGPGGLAPRGRPASRARSAALPPERPQLSGPRARGCPRVPVSPSPCLLSFIHKPGG